MKRIFHYNELTPEQKKAAKESLCRRAAHKAQHDGQVFPYGWAERVAPFLRYVLNRSGAIWNIEPTAGSDSIFTAPLLTMDQLNPVVG